MIEYNDRKGRKEMKIALFDIGTNSIHLLIVGIRPDMSFEVLTHEKDATRLGQGSFKTRKLLARSMNRALAVIGRYHEIAKKNKCDRYIAVATSAVRDARNAGAFVKAVYQKTHLKVRVISGEEEARLIFLAARSSVETYGKKALVIDIGGGSMELILGDMRSVFFRESYRLGSARLSDLFIRKDPPSKKELKRLGEFIERELKEPIKKIRKIGFDYVIGTAGTMINLASMVSHYRDSRPLPFVNQFEMRRKDFEALFRKLVRLGLKERLSLPGLDPKRADMITAGAVLVRILMRLLKVDGITLSDWGIREGMAIDFIEKYKRDAAPRGAAGNLRKESVLSFSRRFSLEETHARQVKKLALSLFDELKALHKLGTPERELLEIAAYLHDVGYFVSYQKHHRHSYYLISQSDLPGFTQEEIEIIARLALYHRKKAPSEQELRAIPVSKRSREIIRQLAALLRVADGLDRSHTRVVQSLKCRIYPKSVRVHVTAKDGSEIEKWQALERADLFQRVFKKKVSFV